MRWDIDWSIGLDAVLLIGAAAGDAMQAELYPDEIAWARERLSPDALETVDQALRVDQGKLIGPTLAYELSADPVKTLAEVISAAESRSFPEVATLLRELSAAGFTDWWTDSFRPAIVASIGANRAALEPYDIISEQARLLGVDLEPRIEVVVTHFAKPYGIRVFGQRFIAHHEYDANVQLRNAAHEIFHPPFDEGDAALWQRLEPLRADPWMRSIVDNHDPKYGYNSFEGIVNEDSTQALDQLVSEKLGFAHERVRRWSTFDGGMHLLAAALYHAMKQDGFDRTGGVYGDWLAGALDRGLLTPSEVRRRAAAVVGEEAVARWL